MSSRKKISPDARPDAEPVGRELKAFYHGRPGDRVSSARFYWPPGDGARESIATHFLGKRRPAGSESLVDTAAKVEVLLRADVPEDYTDPTFLVESYMSKLPAEETSAFAQVTLGFAKATNLHHPWEQGRSWLRDHFVERLGVPVVAILHAPFLAGSDSPIHMHALVLTRRLSAFGWLSAHRELASDAGLAAAEKNWLSSMQD